MPLHHSNVNFNNSFQMLSLAFWTHSMGHWQTFHRSQQSWPPFQQYCSWYFWTSFWAQRNTNSLINLWNEFSNSKFKDYTHLENSLFVSDTNPQLQKILEEKYLTILCPFPHHFFFLFSAMPVTHGSSQA